MASLSSNDPRFENTNDDTSPSKIGKLSDGIFSDDWFRAYESLHKAGVNEREILECLSKIIEMCYKKCAHKSTSVIRQFLLLTETDDLPTYNKMHQLYQFRKSISHEKSRRQTVIDEISASVAQDLNIKDDTDTETTTEQQRHLRHFVSRCTELSWLAVTSSPPLTLELDVTDKDYKDLQIYFSQYSAGDHVFCDTKESLGKVAMVVWPALISEDNDVYNKGSVLVYDAEESHI